MKAPIRKTKLFFTSKLYVIETQKNVGMEPFQFSMLIDWVCVQFKSSNADVNHQYLDIFLVIICYTWHCLNVPKLKLHFFIISTVNVIKDKL